MHEVGSGLATLDVDGHRADVRLNRPEKRNVMTVALMDDLDARLPRGVRGAHRGTGTRGRGTVEHPRDERKVEEQ